MNLKALSLNYTMDEEGNTTAVHVTLSGVEEVDYVNSNVTVTQEELDLDNSTKTKLVEKAKEKLRGYVA